MFIVLQELSAYRPINILLLLIAMPLTALAAQCETHPFSSEVTNALRQDVLELTNEQLKGRRTGRPGAIAAANYLEERFRQLGLTPWQGQFKHSFGYGFSWLSKSGTNLLGWVPGPAPYRLVMAHYDHLGRVNGKVHPGADDNASGVAVMLAIAKRAKETPLSYGVIFAALDAEENGLYGSKELAKQLRDEPLDWVLNLDMVGRPDRRGNARLWWKPNWEKGTKALDGLQQQLCIEKGPRRMRGYDNERYDVISASDHYPFHKRGIPWFYLGVAAHKDYHRPTDTADRLDYDFMASVVNGAWWLLKQPPHKPKS